MIAANKKSEPAVKLSYGSVQLHIATPKIVEVDPEYEAWKRANGLDIPMSREAYIAEFNPCALA